MLVLLPDAASAQPAPVFLVIDEDSIDNGNKPNKFSAKDVNDQIAEIGVRLQLQFFAENAGAIIKLHTGQVGDEGWFRPDEALLPASWAVAGPTADGLDNFLLAGPGLGTADAKGDREALLDKIPGVVPQRTAEIEGLVGQAVCAVVYDSDVSVNYNPLNASLKGANLGTVAFAVISTQPRGGSSLPAVELQILDATEVCVPGVGGEDDGGGDD